MIDKDRIFELRPRSAGERRRFPRIPLARACKLKISPRVSYRPAITRDVSAGGVRVSVEGVHSFEVGTPVVLAVSWHGHPTVTHGETLLAKIVRVDRDDESTSLALAFESPVVVDSIVPSPRAA